MNVHILEARNLIANSNNAVNPFVRIKVGGQEMITHTQQKINNVTWDQQFSFSDLKFTKDEFENGELILEVWDSSGNWFGDNKAGYLGGWVYGEKLIGEYSIGLSTLFRSPNHELYRKWLRLQKSDKPTIQTGSLLVSIFMIGDSELPPVHRDDEQDDDEDNQLLSRQALLEKARGNQGLKVINAPQLSFRMYNLFVKIFKAQGLPMFDADEKKDKNQTFWVEVRTQGCMQETGKLSRNHKDGICEWNQKLTFPVYLPTYNDKVVLRLMFKQGDGYVWSASNEFLANIPEEPQMNDIFNISELVQKEGKMDPQWINVYGVHPHDKVDADGIQPRNSWLGRVLLSLTLVKTDRPQLKRESITGVSDPKSRPYTLQADVFSFSNCSSFINRYIQPGEEKRGKIYVEVKMGNKSSISKKGKIPKNAKKKTEFKWEKNDSEQIPEFDVDICEAAEQRTPVFVYLKKFKDDEKKLGYIRIDMKDLLIEKSQEERDQAFWRPVLDINNGSQIGQLLLRILFTPINKQEKDKPEYQRIKNPTRDVIQFDLIVNIISGYEICGNDNTVEETFVQLQSQDDTKVIKTDSKKGSFPLYNYLSNQGEKFKLYSKLELNPSFSLNLRKGKFDDHSKGKFDDLRKGNFDETHNNLDECPIIGKVQLTVKSLQLAKNQPVEPQYYTFLNDQGDIVGKVLARFALFDSNKYSHPKDKQIYEEFKKYLRQDIVQRNVKFALLSIRGLDESFGGDQYDYVKISLTDSMLDFKYETEDLKNYDLNFQADADLEAAKQNTIEKIDDLNGLIRYQLSKESQNNTWKDMVQYEKVLDKLIKIVDANHEKFAVINSVYRLILQKPLLDKQNKKKSESGSSSEHQWTFRFRAKANEQCKVEKDGKDSNLKTKLDAAYLKITTTEFEDFFKDPAKIDVEKNKDGWKTSVTKSVGLKNGELDKFLGLLFGYKPRVTIEPEEVLKGDDQLVKEEKEKVKDEDGLPCLKVHLSGEPSKNPNIGIIVNFKNVCLNKHLLCWPLIRIQLYKQNILKMQVTEPLFLHAKKSLSRILHLSHLENDDERAVLIAAAQLVNFQIPPQIQSQEDPRRTYLRGVQFQDLSNGNAAFLLDPENEMPEGLPTMDIGKMTEEELAKIFTKKEIKHEESKQESQEQDESNKNQEEKKEPEDEEDQFISLKELKEKLAAGQQNRQHAKEMNKKDIDEAKRMLIDDDEDEDYIDEGSWGKTEAEQEEENNKRVEQVKELEALYKKLKTISQFYEVNPLQRDPQTDQEIIESMKRVREQIETVNNEQNVASELERIIEQRDQENQNQELLDIKINKDIKKWLPFKNLNFYDVPQPVNWFAFNLGGKKPVQPPIMGQIYRSGRQMVAFLRYEVQIVCCFDHNTEDFGDSNMKNEDDEDSNNIPDSDLLDKLLERNFESENVYNLSRQINVFHREFMKTMLDPDPEKLHLICTVLSAQNLTAVDDNLQDWKDTIKQESSKCSADPYIIFDCNEPNNIMKSMYIENTLNPNFNNEVYAHQIKFPENWNLKVSIMDKTEGFALALPRADKLIGMTQIDLEERFLGNKLFLCRTINKIALEQLDQEKRVYLTMDTGIQKKLSEDRQAKLKKDQNYKAQQQRLLDEEKRLREYKLQQPTVEIRTLRKEGQESGSAHGTVKLVTEVLSSADFERRDNTQAERYKKSDEEYEVRLIIYKIIGVYNTDGSDINKLHVEASMKGQNIDDAVQRQATDTHYGVKGGKGVFNWRMKFWLKLPLNFPRIKLQVFSGGTIQSDQALGETTLDLKKTIELTRKQDLEQKKFFVKFVGADGQKVAHGLIQLQVVSKSEAEVNPVGNGQEEPNRDPVLITPIEGRGFGARIGSMFGGISLPSISLPSIYKYAIYFGIALLLIIVAGFLLMFFKK